MGSKLNFFRDLNLKIVLKECWYVKTSEEKNNQEGPERG